MSEHRTNPRRGYCDQPVNWGWRDPIFCKREATKTEEGHHWCCQHAPSSKLARSIAKDEKWKAQQARWKNDSDVATAKIRVIDAAIAWEMVRDEDSIRALERHVQHLKKIRGY